MTTSCTTTSSPDRAYQSWFEAQDAVAAVLNRHNGGTGFRIAAIKGAIYPLGTTFDGVTPSQECQFPTNVIANVDLTPWPEVFEGKAFNADFNLPLEWATAIGIAKAGANLDTQKSFHLRYSSLKQQFVYDGTLRKQLANAECHRSLGDLVDRPKAILRGYYAGTLEVSSTDAFDVGASFTVTTSAGLTIKYNRSGGFLIQQTNAVPWFGIYSDIRAAKDVDLKRIKPKIDPKPPAKIITIRLEAPSGARAEELSRIK
ncbi:MAG: hypothetical protein ACYDH9_24230 [Limisphaerales bacterium]